MSGFGRHDVSVIECPFCKKGKIEMYHKEGYLQAKTSRISAGAKSTIHRVADKYIVKTDCPECKKTRKEIQEALDSGVTKRLSIEERLQRLREAGLPTRVETKR